MVLLTSSIYKYMKRAYTKSHFFQLLLWFKTPRGEDPCGKPPGKTEEWKPNPRGTKMCECPGVALGGRLRIDWCINKHNFSANCCGGCLNWVYRHLSDVFIFPLHGILGFKETYQSVNVRFIEHPQRSTFQIILWFYAILRVFVLYSHYGYSISNEKLNGH